MAGYDDGVDLRDRRSDAEPEGAPRQAGEADRTRSDSRIPSDNRPRSDSRVPSDNRPRSRRRWYTYPITNFYPGYSNSVGRLDRIAPISSVRMQRVLPRYNMSTEQTRTSGLGPPLIDYPVSVELSGEHGSPFSRMVEERRAPAGAAGGRGEGSDAGECAGALDSARTGRSSRGGATDESEEIDDDLRGRTVDIEV